MPKLSTAQWAEIDRIWHDQLEVKQARILEQFDISAGSLRKHVENYKWTYPRGPRAASNVAPVTATYVTPAVTTLSEPVSTPPPPHEFEAKTTDDRELAAGNLEALLNEERGRRIAAESRIAELESDVSRYKPYVEVEMYTTAEGVIELLGENKMYELVAMSYADINRQRRKDYLPDFQPSEDEGRAKVLELATEILERRTKFEEENPHRTRVLKMRTNNGDLVQIGAENQMNNMAGSRSDWYTLYTDKGFKILVDKETGATICGSLNCWRPGAKDLRGGYMHQGYCSEGHMRWCEANKKNAATALSLIGEAKTSGSDVGLTRTGLRA